MKRFRYWLSRVLFDLAAWVHPAAKQHGMAHYVGNKWLSWTVEYVDPARVCENDTMSL